MVKRATIHLVDINGYKGEINIRFLEAIHPGIIEELKRGDIIEDISNSGHYCKGIYMFDGYEVVDLYTEYDEVGSPPPIFGCITEFPLDYWSWVDIEDPDRELSTNKKYVGNIYTSKFYWHSNEPSLQLYGEPFDLLNKIKNNMSYNNIIKFEYDGIEYQLIVDNKEEAILDLTDFGYLWILRDTGNIMRIEA